MIKYNDRKQILNYLSKAAKVIINHKFMVVTFLGVELERCSLKLKRELIDDIKVASEIFEIEVIEVFE